MCFRNNIHTAERTISSIFISICSTNVDESSYLELETAYCLTTTESPHRTVVKRSPHPSIGSILIIIGWEAVVRDGNFTVGLRHNIMFLHRFQIWRRQLQCQMHPEWAEKLWICSWKLPIFTRSRYPPLEAWYNLATWHCIAFQMEPTREYSQSDLVPTKYKYIDENTAIRERYQLFCDKFKTHLWWIFLFLKIDDNWCRELGQIFDIVKFRFLLENKMIWIKFNSTKHTFCEEQQKGELSNTSRN